jgi:type IV pilus assembly protein PilV
LNNRGFSLIEIVASLLILAVGLLAVIAMQISSVRGNSFSGEMTQASVFAQDRLESLRTLEPSDAGFAAAMSLGLHNDGTLVGTVFSRQYTVASNPGTTMLTITVTVSWNDGVNHNVSFSTVRAL